MSPSSRIPALLQPVVRTPKDDSLLLLTSTLDCSANWLLVRFLYDALRKHSSSSSDGADDGGEGPTKVVLVSWTRDHDFWRQEVRKGTGLDLNGLRAQGRFAFVDGLSALFLGEPAGSRPQSMPGAPPGRAPLQPRPSTGNAGLYTLSSASLDHAAATITAAIGGLAAAPSTARPDTLVLLDNPDLLLAATPSLAPSRLTSLFLTLHAHNAVSHLLVHLQSDLALLAPSFSPQPLQVAHQHLLVKTAHMSARVLAVRLLNTGVARDVSGVLRATANTISWTSIGPPSDADAGGPAGADSSDPLALEVLYKLHGDGSVKVFERGTTAV